MTFVETVYNVAKNVFNYKLIIILVIIFLGISSYYYIKIVRPKLNKKYVPNKEFINTVNTPDEIPTATLYYFYTNWCPLCKKAKQEWNALQSEIGTTIKNVNVVFREIDCDSDTATADRFNITGYPTFKLVYNNKTYEYDAKPDKDILVQFLNSVLS